MSELPQPLVLSEVKDRVLTLRMNRADKKNALTQVMYSEMARTITEAATNNEVRALLIAGSGGSFTAGNDLQDFLKAPPASMDSPVIRFMMALAAFPKPVVAAVNGPAIGIGMTMLLHCDLVYAGRSARLQMPFVNIGICPEFASSLLMPRIMGHARAAEVILLGEAISADQAASFGIVNAVMAEDEVETFAFARAQRLAEQPPNAMRVSKMLLKRWTEKEVLEAIPLEAGHFGPMLHLPEAKEAITAVVTKRKPDFSRFN